jgi:hypothetical protein
VIFTRLLWDRFPAYRGLFTILDCAGLFLMIAAWVLCFVVPAIAYIFLRPPYFLAMIFYWLFTFFGGAMIYISVKEWKKFRQGRGNNP